MYATGKGGGSCHIHVWCQLSTAELPRKQLRRSAAVEGGLAADVPTIGNFQNETGGLFFLRSGVQHVGF